MEEEGVRALEEWDIRHVAIQHAEETHKPAALPDEDFHRKNSAKGFMGKEEVSFAQIKKCQRPSLTLLPVFKHACEEATSKINAVAAISAATDKPDGSVSPLQDLVLQQAAMMQTKNSGNTKWRSRVNLRWGLKKPSGRTGCNE